MFKSVFSRIMSTFTVILLCCFLLLIFVVASGLVEEGREKELSELGVAANEVCYFLESMHQISSLPPSLLLRSESFRSNMMGIANFTEADITVLRADGVVVVSSSDERIPGEQMLTDTMIAEIRQDERAYAVSNLNGVLPEKQLNRFDWICTRDGTVLYMVVVTGRSSLQGELASKVIKQVVVVAIWIFFAAMISVSLISKRITDPIKQIGDAAKEYALGRFSVRVKVDGQDEITELSRAFNQMASGLAAHEANRNTFIANVSHDLRTPMTTISGFVDGILDGTIPAEQQTHYLQIISGEVHRLSRLVNTLLEVSRLESGSNLKMQEFNLTEKARQILISLVGKIEQKNIEIDFADGDEDVFVAADPDMIHQVLYNLLDNAVKFTGEGGTIAIRIGSSRGKKANVSIRNTGEGIPQEEIPHIFERFYKSDRSRGLDKTGTGLGLYIVKTILDKHGESIYVESEVGSYTEFRFNLSLASGRPRGKEFPAEPKKE